MATTKLYTLTLVEVTYALDATVDGPAYEEVRNGYHLRARVGQTIRPLRIQIGRQEKRTPLLYDVPASELAGARALVERSVRAANERDGGERYIVSERQRGRVMRDGRHSTAAA